MTDLITKRRTYRTRDLFMLSLPMMASYLLEMLIGLTDAAFLGRTTPEALGAAAVSGVLFMTVLMIGVGYAAGMQAAMARANGAGRDDETGQLFRSGVLTLFFFSLLGVVFSVWAGPHLFSLWLGNPKVAEDASAYLFWRGLGLPIAFLCAALRAYFVAILRPNVLTTSAVAMIVTNMLLNYVLIFGCGPIPAMGISGAAMASAAAEAAALAFLVREVWKTPKARRSIAGDPSRADKPSLWAWDPRTQKALFVLGRWMMAQETVSVAAWFAFFVAIEHLGAAELALSNVLRQLGGVLFLFIHALGSTAGTVGSNLLGEHREAEVPGIVRRGLVLAVIMTGSVAALFALLPRPIIGLLTNLPEVVNAPLGPYWMLLVSFIPGAPGMYLLYVLAALGLTRAAATASLTSVVVYQGFIAWLASGTPTLTEYWFSDSVCYTAAGLVALAYYLRTPWRKAAREAKRLRT